MTEIEARKRAEKIVFVYYTIGNIEYECQIRNIPIKTPNGKDRKRSDMETELINAMIKEMTTK